MGGSTHAAARPLERMITQCPGERKGSTHSLANDLAALLLHSASLTLIRRKVVDGDTERSLLGEQQATRIANVRHMQLCRAACTTPEEADGRGCATIVCAQLQQHVVELEKSTRNTITHVGLWCGTLTQLPLNHLVQVSAHKIHSVAAPVPVITAEKLAAREAGNV